jgi:hypothetical protein
MRPLLFQYLEEPTGSVESLDRIAYSYECDLHVDRESGLPAFDSSTGIDPEGRFVYLHPRQPLESTAALLATETFTKDQKESSDDDAGAMMEASLAMFLETQSSTKTLKEPAGSDPEQGFGSLQQLLETQSDTRTINEPPDADPSRKCELLDVLLETQSGTQVLKEQSDDDSPSLEWF